MGWMIGQSGGQRSGVRGLDSREVRRMDSWKEGDTGAGTLGHSDGRTVEKKLTLEQKPSDDRTLGKLERR